MIFDVDGLLVETEQYWDEARRSFVAEHGGAWTEQDQRNVMGDNSVQWSTYLQQHFDIALPNDEIVEAVQSFVLERVSRHVPVLPGAVETVRALAERYPLGVASSAPTRVIEAILSRIGVRQLFRAVASSDEVSHGKPRPDVYLLCARRLGVPPSLIVVFEDSVNGVRAAKAAGMKVVAVPNRQYSRPSDFEIADLVIASLTDLRPETLPRLF